MADILTSFKPQLINAIAEVFKDPASVQQLNQYQADLNDIIARIHQCETVNQTMAREYTNLMNQLYAGVSNQSLSALAMNASKETALNRQLEALINELFQKEHEILDFLTKGQARTAMYTIYYGDDLGNGEEVFRGTISAEELYNSGSMTITNSGITLEKSKMAELFKTHGQTSRLSQEQTMVLADLVKTAIENMQDAFRQLEKELEGISRQMQKEHLGESLYKKYTNLKRIVGTESRIEGLYGSYLMGTSAQMTNKRTGLLGAYINRGHIYEALERYVNGDTGGLTELLGESLGNDPWWTQGDVGDIQVKAMIGQHFNRNTLQWEDNNTRVASMKSLLEVAIFLQAALRDRNIAMENFSEEIKQKIEANDTGQATNGSIEKLASQSIQRLLAERFKTRIDCSIKI